MEQLLRTPPQPHATLTPRGGHHACVAGRDRPQNPTHTERAPMRGTLGRGVGVWRSLGWGRVTGSGRSAAGALPSLGLFFRWGKEIRGPYYDGYFGLGQENDIYKTHRYAEQLS